MEESRVESKITYFTNPFRELGYSGLREALETAYGKEHEAEMLSLARKNTEVTMNLTRQRAEELNIKTILVASSTGYTAVKAVEVFNGFRVITITTHTGYREPNVQQFTEENRKIVESKGGIVHTSIHAFSEIGGRITREPQTFLGVGHVVANTLRIFGDGMKVACQIAVMAADAGLVRTDEDVISIGGNGRGANTALVISPVNSKDFFTLLVKEILCKPHFEGLHGHDIATPV